MIESIIEWINNLGWTGYLVFIAFYIFSTVAFLPGSVLTLAAGTLFGVVGGTVAVSIASVTGATFAFLVSRYFLRGTVEKKLGTNPKFKAIDQAIGREGPKIIFLLRLSPVIPFNLSNYLYGLSSIKLVPYIIASWIGMFPGTIMYVYFGSIAKNAVEAASEGTMGNGKFVLQVIGLIATVVVTLYVTKIAKKALKESNQDLA